MNFEVRRVCFHNTPEFKYNEQIRHFSLKSSSNMRKNEFYSELEPNLFMGNT